MKSLVEQLKAKGIQEVTVKVEFIDGRIELEDGRSFITPEVKLEVFLNQATL